MGKIEGNKTTFFGNKIKIEIQKFHKIRILGIQMTKRRIKAKNKI